MDNNSIGKTETVIPEEMFIPIGNDGMIIDLGRVTVEDWMKVIAAENDSDRFLQMMKFNEKVLGQKFLNTPLVYMSYINKRVMAAVTRLFLDEEGQS